MAIITNSFAVFGDVNSSSSPNTPRPWIDAYTVVMNAIRDSGVDFAISVGDHLNDNNYGSGVATAGWGTYNSANWDFVTYKALEDSVLTKDGEETPAFPVYRIPGDNDHLGYSSASTFVGNRCTEVAGGWNTAFSDIPNTTTNYTDASGGETYRRWWWKDINGTRFIFLSTEAPFLGYIGYVTDDPLHPSWPANSPQAQWLVNVLNGTPSSCTQCGGPLTNIVVIMHEPLYNGRTNSKYSTTKSTERDALASLFAKHGVDLVISGDVHAYRRHPHTTDGKVTQHVTMMTPCGFSHLSFSDNGGPIVDNMPYWGTTDGCWESYHTVTPMTGYHGFLIVHTRDDHVYQLLPKKVDLATGAVSEIDMGHKKRHVMCGGYYYDVPKNT